MIANAEELKSRVRDLLDTVADADEFANQLGQLVFARTSFDVFGIITLPSTIDSIDEANFQSIKDYPVSDF